MWYGFITHSLHFFLNVRVGFWSYAMYHVPCFGARGLVTTVMRAVSNSWHGFITVGLFVHSPRSYDPGDRVLGGRGLEAP
jgi:hypothetical protein